MKDACFGYSKALYQFYKSFPFGNYLDLWQSNNSGLRLGNKRTPRKSTFYGIENTDGVLTSSRNVTPNRTKSLRTLKSSESTRNFLFHFYHANITFGLIIVKRHAEIVHKS